MIITTTMIITTPPVPHHQYHQHHTTTPPSSHHHHTINTISMIIIITLHHQHHTISSPHNSYHCHYHHRKVSLKYKPLKNSENLMTSSLGDISIHNQLRRHFPLCLESVSACALFRCSLDKVQESKREVTFSSDDVWPGGP